MGVSSKAMEVREASAKYDLQSASSGVPVGYKQTEVGVIPKDWEVSPVRQKGDVLTGKALAVNAPGTQRPYLRTKNVFDGRIDIADVLTMPMTEEQFTQFQIRNGDVLLNEGQSLELVGRCAIYQNEYPEPCAIQNALLRFRAHEGVCGEFASYLFRHCQQTGVFARIALQTTSVAHLGGSRFERLHLPWPTEPEQHAIATALSDMDALLDGLDRLIAKKRDLKQAAMQQLLTGQTRLPGFEGEWEVKQLGDEAVFLKGKGLPKSALNTFGPVPCVHYGELFTQYSEEISETISKTSDSPDHFRSNANDVLMPTSDVTPRGLAKASCVMLADVVLGGDILVIRTNEKRINGVFLSHVIRKEEAQVLRLVTGTTVFHLYGSDMKKFVLAIPSIAEQQVIVTVLSDMDAEIESLEQRRHKTRDLKQAMMQELLTGRTRLIKPQTQDVTDNKTQPVEKKANVHFMRSVLAAEIVNQLHEEPTFGHVKFEKLLFLVEHLCEVDTGSTYRRQAAGPYDNKALRSIDSQLRKQQWFDARKEGGRYRYEPMNKQGGHKTYFDRYFSGISTGFMDIVETFRTLDTERCEIVATLFSAWSDLLRDKGAVSDDMIVHEVLNNWHESKQRITEDRWLSALGWMRGKGFVPKTSTSAALK